MKTVLSLWKGHIPAIRPVLQDIAEEEAQAFGTTTTRILCGSTCQVATRARTRVVNRMLAETGCTVSDLARVWGVPRKTVQRHIERSAA